MNGEVQINLFLRCYRRWKIFKITDEEFNILPCHFNGIKFHCFERCLMLNFKRAFSIGLSWLKVNIHSINYYTKTWETIMKVSVESWMKLKIHVEPFVDIKENELSTFRYWITKLIDTKPFFCPWPSFTFFFFWKLR